MLTSPGLLGSQACGRKILLPKKVPGKRGKEAKCPLHPPLGELQSWGETSNGRDSSALPGEQKAILPGSYAPPKRSME